MEEKRQTPIVELGGRLWELRFGHKAMRMFCRATKCNLSTFDDALDTYDNEILLLWCILQTQDPSVKREDLDIWLDDLLLEDVFRIIQDAVGAAMPSTAGKRLQAMENAQDSADKEPDDTENPTQRTTSGIL